MNFSKAYARVVSKQALKDYRRYKISKKNKITHTLFNNVFATDKKKPRRFDKLRRKYIRRIYRIYFIYNNGQGKKYIRGERISSFMGQKLLRERIQKMKLSQIKKRIQSLKDIKNIIKYLLEYPHIKRKQQSGLQRRIQFFYAIKYWKFMKKIFIKRKKSLVDGKEKENIVQSGTGLQRSQGGIFIDKEFISSQQPSQKSSQIGQYLSREKKIKK